MLYLNVFLLSNAALYLVLNLFFCFFVVVWSVPRILVFTVLSVGFLTLLTLFSYCAYLWVAPPELFFNWYSNYWSLNPLLFNSNCFAIFAAAF